MTIHNGAVTAGCCRCRPYSASAQRRQDLGDLTGLMHSLQTVGLIHPLVVTDTLELVVGSRRLKATKRLGATMIEVRRVGDLTEVEKRIIELEENLHRQELTPLERSRAQAELASTVAVHLREEAQAQSAQGVQPDQSQDVHTPTRTSPGPDELNSCGVEKSVHEMS